MITSITNITSCFTQPVYKWKQVERKISIIATVSASGIRTNDRFKIMISNVRKKNNFKDNCRCNKNGTNESS